MFSDFEFRTFHGTSILPFNPDLYFISLIEVNVDSGSENQQEIDIASKLKEDNPNSQTGMYFD